MRYTFPLFLEPILGSKESKMMSKNFISYLLFFMKRAGNFVEEVYCVLASRVTVNKPPLMVGLEMAIQLLHLVELGFENPIVMILSQPNQKDLGKYWENTKSNLVLVFMSELNRQSVVTVPTHI